jgi:hypothetical protein
LTGEIVDIKPLKQYLVEVVLRLESWSYAQFEALKDEPWSEHSGESKDILLGKFFQADVEFLEYFVDAGENVSRILVCVDNSIQYLGTELFVDAKGNFKWDRTFFEYIDGTSRGCKSIDS